MTWRENQIWLTTSKSLIKTNQLDAIKERFFYCDRSRIKENDSAQYSPMIVVNGVPFLVPDSIDVKSKEKVISLLIDKNISEINIIDRQPDEWTFHRPFAGVIIIKVNDKRTFNKIMKMRLQ